MPANKLGLGVPEQSRLLPDDTPAPRLLPSYDFAHGGQLVSFTYGHIPPTVGDMRTVSTMLRREADRIDAGLAALGERA
jgi:hypothetical protein